MWGKGEAFPLVQLSPPVARGVSPSRGAEKMSRRKLVSRTHAFPSPWSASQRSGSRFGAAGPSGSLLLQPQPPPFGGLGQSLWPTRLLAVAFGKHRAERQLSGGPAPDSVCVCVKHVPGCQGVLRPRSGSAWCGTGVSCPGEGDCEHRAPGTAEEDATAPCHQTAPRTLPGQ